ncbi:S41 family peptidase [Pontimicrobium sp. IMCC45349]|uniref:S41 family peptidase n=1 Tax=Pontimicrobium sp. IMCC45349 TaxID=3391574 RepID=UPI0039A0D1CF
MKLRIKAVFVLIVLGLTYSCFEDNDDNAISASEIKDFVWKGMNAVYLYKQNIPDLANDRFSSNNEYATYLNSFSTPESLFESLIYERQTVDRFSWITNDYIALEEQLSGGLNFSNGMEANLYLVPGSITELYGVVRLVLPGSNADNQGLERGQIFDKVDGVTLTLENWRQLISGDSFTLNLANYNDNGTEDTDDDSLESTTDTVNLTKTSYTENPVYLSDIFQVDGENVGYLVYNGFTPAYDSQLNAVFGDFAANNVQHLILDLRYNPGGNVGTATALGSMVTGQFNGDVFAKLNYNDELAGNNSEYLFSNTLENGNTINNLNLNKVYVLTTGSSASASEMIINSLRAHMDQVIQIGTTTTGKSQASVTIYDSPNLQREGANPNHNYAMQPLIAITVNKFDEQVPSSGLVPTIALEEVSYNYGTLGDVNETLLAAALADIEGSSRLSIPQFNFEVIGDSNKTVPFSDIMYIKNSVFTQE